MSVLRALIRPLLDARNAPRMADAGSSDEHSTQAAWVDQLGRTEVDQLGRTGVDQLSRTQIPGPQPVRWTSLAELRWTSYTEL